MFSQAVSGGDINLKAVGAAAAIGGLSGGLSVAKNVATGLRYAGQVALSVGDGLARSKLTGQGYSGTDLASDVILGGLGEGLGDVLGSANRVAQKGYLETTAARLRSGPATLPSGRSATVVAGRMDNALAWINASEGALAGAASGAGSRVLDDDPNGHE